VALVASATSARLTGIAQGAKSLIEHRSFIQRGREVLDIAAAAIRPGITTLEIDKIVHHECMQRNAYPSPLGYHMFPRSVCT
jgi:methionyl aminopeptidase